MTLTNAQRDTIARCPDCMSKVCSVCEHEPCPGCAPYCDDCDHPDCIIWNTRGTGTKNHQCVFPRCEMHQELSS